MFQSPCLLPWLTSQQNVQIAATQGARSRSPSDAVSVAELVGVADAASQLPPHLSLGTQQCVSLARALSMEPRFLLLDERFSMLDSLTRFELQDILLRVWEQSGKTVGWSPTTSTRPSTWLIDFLEHHAHQSRPSVLDAVLRKDS